MFNIITETFGNCNYIYYKNKFNILYYNYKLTNICNDIFINDIFINDINEIISDDYILCIHNLLNIQDYNESDAYITY